MASTRIVRREVLERTPRALLVRIFAPFADFFAAHGIALDALAATEQMDRALVRRAYDALHADVEAVPGDLRANLAAIDGLSNSSGQTALFELCPELATVRRGPEETAATALVDYPEAFARARKVADSSAGPTFSDFDASSLDAPEVTPTTTGAILAGVLAWLVRQGRSRHCDHHLVTKANELHLEIDHGRLPATDDVVGESLELTQMTLVRTERAHVIVDLARGRASIHGAHAAIKDLLRRLVGEHWYGNPDHFRRGGIYTLDPLARNLDDALSFADVPRIKEITLLGLQVATPYARDRRDSLEGEDVRTLRDSDRFLKLLADGAVPEWFKLRMKIEGYTRPFVVELAAARKKAPSKLPDEIEKIVDEWLIARGFIVIAEHLRAADAESTPASQAV
jgi:hypothetical protein